MLLKGTQDTIFRENLKLSLKCLSWENLPERAKDWSARWRYFYGLPVANIQQAVSKQAHFGEGANNTLTNVRPKFGAEFRGTHLLPPGSEGILARKRCPEFQGLSLASCELQATGHGARKQWWVLGRSVDFSGLHYFPN